MSLAQAEAIDPKSSYLNQQSSLWASPSRFPEPSWEHFLRSSRLSRSLLEEFRGLSIPVLFGSLSGSLCTPRFPLLTETPFQEVAEAGSSCVAPEVTPGFTGRLKTLRLSSHGMRYNALRVRVDQLYRPGVPS
ncbi:uncharacterized protein STEHIDRAFT_156028 [Stereum hirsutum FP-91666 SS1]|uniref:uncharacterized protein n=1 Tax=Stereum hirsutum (strain FP-91666) TaxID=721885 RepID=UPI000440B51B|nr:uncharacterized protein STEHIDRAFT_156028 [Stereum hirsutum FP-91666 SS1]EIM87033.1 hypothetical protein STEHIDRAFT_156028 [Stereum hirsutum FP-91666 SS1]